MSLFNFGLLYFVCYCVPQTLPHTYVCFNSVTARCLPHPAWPQYQIMFALFINISGFLFVLFGFSSGLFFFFWWHVFVFVFVFIVAINGGCSLKYNHLVLLSSLSSLSALLSAVCRSHIRLLASLAHSWYWRSLCV